MNYLFRQIIIAIVVLLSVGVTSCGDGKKSEASDSQNNPQTDSLEAPVAVEENISRPDMDIFADLEKDEMVFVKGGTFLMGAQSKDSSLPNYDEEGIEDESPVHQVTLSDYYIGKYEVTQQLWECVMKYNGKAADGTMMSAYDINPWLGLIPNPSYGKGHYFPAYGVSLEDATDIFILRLNKITGKKYRLPTEAEWEYAARGGNKSRGYKYSGSNVIEDVAWYYENVGCGTHEVGTKAPNELGIYDMSGNVKEWCNDMYGDYSSNNEVNPPGPDKGLYCVVRGGHWCGDASNARVANRSSYCPDHREENLGFRLACDAAEYSEGSLTVFVGFDDSSDMDIFTNLEKDEMVLVEGGEFLMGTQSDSISEYDIVSNESPQHLVVLDSYYIGRYEVTRQLWEYVMAYDGEAADGTMMSAYEGGVWPNTMLTKNKKGDYYPMSNVSWEDVVNNFIPRLNKITGKTFRLPTEAEWEYAARGGNKSNGYEYSGSNCISEVAWYWKNTYSIEVVGGKLSNELDIYDMSGNVKEWCSDWYLYGYYSVSPKHNPQGPSRRDCDYYNEHKDKVCRGGDYLTSSCRVASRSSYPLTHGDDKIGFRLVCSCQ